MNKFSERLESAIDAFFKSGHIQQHEWELRTFLNRALSELKPERTVELGTYKGCTSALLSLITSGTTVTVDIKDYGTELSRPFSNNLKILHGNACEPEIVNKAVKILGGPIDLLLVDDGHHYDVTLNEYNLWKPFVRSGGWICFHDINPLANIGPHGVQPDEMQTTRFWNDLKEDKIDIIATKEHKAWRGVIPHGGIGIIIK